MKIKNSSIVIFLLFIVLVLIGLSYEAYPQQPLRLIEDKMVTGEGTLVSGETVAGPSLSIVSVPLSNTDIRFLTEVGSSESEMKSEDLPLTASVSRAEDINLNTGEAQLIGESTFSSDEIEMLGNHDQIIKEGIEPSEDIRPDEVNIVLYPEEDNKQRIEDIEISTVPPSSLTIFSETFEGAFPGGNWTIYGSPSWDDTSYDKYSGSWSGWCADTTQSPANGYVNNMNAWMVYGPFSLSDATNASVDFYYRNKSETGFDYFKWGASTDDEVYSGWQISGNQDSWRSQTFDLTSVPTLGDLTGQNQVWIAFIFQSDSSITDKGAYIDDIVIQKSVDAVDFAAVDVYPADPADVLTPLTTVTEGQQIRIVYKYTYTGPAPSATHTSRVQLDSNSPCNWAGTLPSAGTWYLSCPTITATAGDHRIRGWADVNNNIAESNESNNNRDENPSFSVDPDADPDIYISPTSLIINQSSPITASDQNAILLKKRQFVPEYAPELPVFEKPRHSIIQFEGQPQKETLDELISRGVEILQYVPKHAVMAYIPANTELTSISGIRWVGSLQPADKISRYLKVSLDKGFILVDVFPDISRERTDEIITIAGGVIIENTYLSPNTYLVSADESVVTNLSLADEISWIWAASDAVIEGLPVHSCPGGMTALGPVPNYVTNGPGWDGPGQGSADLTYHFENGTPDIVGDQEEIEVELGLNGWSLYADITWTETGTSGLSQSIDILWGSYEHGDGFPFDGPGGVLAHTFSPSPPNPESIAGDMHFDESETWRIGSDYDVFSVALHEAGHSLGLAHSGDPNAVMYPVYKMVTGLQQDDIDGIQSIYASAGDDSFTIYNEGGSTLTITNLQACASWMSLSPTAPPPFDIAPGGSRVVTVTVNWDEVPDNGDSCAIQVYSNDPDENPYPGGVTVTATMFILPNQNPDTTGVFRPTNGALYLKNQNTTGFADMMLTYGLPGDKPITGDWDGDGVDTIGIYRNGVFYLRNSNTNGFADIVFAFGAPTDQPIAGDWDGDGVDTIGLYRDGIIFLRNSNSSGSPDMTFFLGVAGDIGIAGDWDGDGIDTTGVFRPTNGALYLKNQNTTGFADIVLTYGLPGDKPVTGDWDGDGIDTIGVYRNGTFMLRNSNTNGFADITFTLGIPSDEPISGDWDGLP